MQYWMLLLVSLAFSAVGFYMYIYFFSVGYGLSVAAIGAALAIGFRERLGAGECLLCLLLFLYGLRLAGYLLIREIRSKAYRKVLSPEMTRSRQMPLGAKLAIWVSCALLYTLQTIPVFFRLKSGAPADGMLWVGLAVMVCGLGLETGADLQKSAAKKKAPYVFVSTGLFGFVRCPNYLGELIFWLGVLLQGDTVFRGPLQWALAGLGYLLLIYIMFSGARRLEIRQNRNYGGDPAYQRYVKTVPILLPFVPLYSVEKHKWLAA
ncbi:MAG: DUF1295 domain-containing protein [Clostridia bacterium]|nr:DUF1295 domain-containing protein [Clostridia bacterium]